jgi:D-alanine-D-alanine ligase
LVVPIYITRAGRWLSGDNLRDIETYRTDVEPNVTEVYRDLSDGVIRPLKGKRGIFGRGAKEAVVDTILPAVHGTYGEDGSLQGLLELSGVPYVGSSVSASAVAMDKILTKAVLRAHGLPTLESKEILRETWVERGEEVVTLASETFRWPVYVKPVSLGSSIGVNRCVDEVQAIEALRLVFELDRAALIEPSVEHAVEINCAVLGAHGGDLRASVCEQPIAQQEVLSFDDKYLRGSKTEGMKGAERIIPAPIGEGATKRVQELAKQSFSALGCAGLARVDFLMDKDGRIIVNELNTIPGSLSFYLWEHDGFAFADLLDELLRLAFVEHEKKRATTRVFASTLLASAPVSGVKGNV